MHKLLLLLGIIINLELSAQQIPNNSFEDWQPELGGTYDEPGGNWWATLNFLRGFGSSAPITVNKTTDSHSGQYAAEITTGEFGSFIIPGLLVCGEVGDIDLQNPTEVIKRGQPFTALPEKFMGYFKHSPVNGDSAVANAMLTRYNNGAGKRDTIALAEELFKTEVSSYTEFEVDFDYYMQGVTPDTIIISLVSSAGGQDLAGQPGSKLFIDELSLSYVSGIIGRVNDLIEIKTYPNPFTSAVTFEAETTSSNRELSIYNLDGKLVHNQTFVNSLINVNLEGLSASSYSYVVKDNGRVTSTGTLTKN